jgi:hypothetical protein
MNKRKLLIAFLVCLMAGLILWIRSASGDNENDEVKYQSWAHNERVRVTLRRWERRLPEALGRILSRTDLALEYEGIAAGQKEELLRSGYLVEISVTNDSRLSFKEVGGRLVKVRPKDANGTYFWVRTDCIGITCRTQDVPVFRQALNAY